ncbi:MAG TPA: hypothetical protein VMV40_01550 [Acidiferrobacter sp.]|nr:hypothetical protein [Acidiferrobacter sp.]
MGHKGGICALDQLPGIALRGALDMVGHPGWEQASLRMEQVFDAATQQRPVFLLDGEVPSEIADGDLAHLAADALAAHQAVGEIAFAGDLVTGSGLTGFDG